MNSGVYGHSKTRTLTPKTKYLTAKANTSQQEEKLAGKANTCTVPELGGGKPGTQGSRKGCWAWVKIQHGGIQ